jgi:hypothetical protein
MATYKFVDADQLDADLQSVADKIRTKGGTSAKLSFPDGFESAVDAISIGVTVQRTTGGSFTVNSSGNATVNCGFQPDMVAIDLGEANGAKAVVVAPFYEISADNVSEAGTYETSVLNDDDLIIITTFSQTTTGFSVYMRAYDLSLDKQSLPTKTYSYVAVKYT